MSEFSIDALLPAEMATRAEYLGVRKAEMPILRMFMLAVLAGAFIALGAVFSTTASAGGIPVTDAAGLPVYSASLPYGVVRLLAGIVFSLGLILVVVGGAELFTGNNLIVMAWASGKVSAPALLKNWAIVYAGNFFGSVGTAVLVFLGRQYTFGGNAVGISALRTAVAKCDLDFPQALALGILCNALVCMAVWLTFSARSTIASSTTRRWRSPSFFTSGCPNGSNSKGLMIFPQTAFNARAPMRLDFDASSAILRTAPSVTSTSMP